MKGLILVTGSDGLVGSRFVELTQRKNFLHLPTQVEMDLTDPTQIKEVISKYNFSAVVNFAAYTDVGEAEKQRGDKSGPCWQVNVDGVKNLIEAINPNVTHYIQISTDMVFSGREDDPGPYSEDHEPKKDQGKLTWYGFTKLQAEELVREKLYEKATILRLIYPVRAQFEPKLDYLRKLLRFYDEGELYPMFTDQKISITFIDEVAYALDKIIAQRTTGVLHVSCPDTVAPFDLASYLFEKARGVKNVVKPTTLDSFLEKTGNPAYRYPKKHGLKVDKTQKALGMKFSSWREIVDRLVSQGLK